MRRVIVWMIGVGVLVAVGAVGLRVPGVQDAVMRRTIARRMSAPP